MVAVVGWSSSADLGRGVAVVAEAIVVDEQSVAAITMARVLIAEPVVCVEVVTVVVAVMSVVSMATVMAAMMMPAVMATMPAVAAATCFCLVASSAKDYQSQDGDGCESLHGFPLSFAVVLKGVVVTTLLSGKPPELLQEFGQHLQKPAEKHRETQLNPFTKSHLQHRTRSRIL